MSSATGNEETLNASSLKESELRYRRLFEAAQDGILILDAKTGAITDVNPFLVRMLGYSREEFLEKRLWEVGAFKDVEASQDAFHSLLEHEYIRYEDLPLRANDGRLIQVEFVSNVYWAGADKVIQCNIRDITDRKQAQDALLQSEARLREQSVRDHLTGLFNRRYMEETLERELLRASRKGLSLGIIMLDVDDFKRFNDTCGHAAGDAILRELGSLLLRHVRGEDIPSRYGGDEFIIVLPDTSREVTRARAERLCEHARHLHIPFEGLILEAVTLSMGIAASPESGATTNALLKAVDDALYRAKRAGRGGVVAANRTSIPAAVLFQHLLKDPARVANSPQSSRPARSASASTPPVTFSGSIPIGSMTMDSNDISKFTCSKCGNHELVVSHTWIIQAGTNSETWREWGPLRNDNHWQYEFKEKIQANEDDEVERGDFSEFEEDDSSSEPEEYEINETETNRESDDFFINCGNCDREIEFGWSQPDRRGIILPVEFSDFDPGKAWPDPKYVDAWQQRGWLRSRNIQT